MDTLQYTINKTGNFLKENMQEPRKMATEFNLIIMESFMRELLEMTNTTVGAERLTTQDSSGMDSMMGTEYIHQGKYIIKASLQEVYSMVKEYTLQERR